MQAALIRLTGPTRGVVDVFDEEAVRLGTDQSNEIALEAHLWPMVVPFHAEIRQKDGSFLLVDVSFAGLWVNGQKVSQKFLTDGDTIQLGDAGPQFRFRTHLKRDQRRSFPAILSDTGAVSRDGGDAARVSATEFVKHLALALVREASWTARVGVIGGLLLVLSFLIAVPIFLVRGYRVTEETQQEVTALAARLREERFSREELSTRVETEQEVLARQQSALAALEEERRRLRSALSETEKKLRRAEAESVAAERIIARYSGGVLLIQGALGFQDPTGRPLRYLGMDERGRPLLTPSGRPLLSPEGKGPEVTAPFTGSGFLVSRNGGILTNRHVAEPWRDEEELLPVLAAGYRPTMKLFRAFLPGSAEPVPLKVLSIASNADVAVLHGALGRARPPVLELDRTGKEAVPGRAVILLGYPAGIEALLAKADSAAARELIMGDVQDLYRLAELMAARRMIRPSATQGHLGDVQPHQLVYDAPTTFGGSGGPLLTRSGRVVGISYGVMGGFAGSNFGVPIRFGLDLLEKTIPR